MCQEHKTAKAYGDLIKLLTAGLKEAMRNYNKLPRPEGCVTFFVPSHGGAKMAMAKSLQSFNKMLLSDCKVKPSTNLVRKKFHKSLIEFTRDEEKMKEFLVVLDAHSKKTIDAQLSN